MGLRRKFLRMKLEVNKEAMLADPDKAETIPGVTIARDVEVFYLEPKGAQLSEGAP
jgi:phage host-nuclease inhibitor protein Gam